MSDSQPEISVIIPAYNEERRLGPTLARIGDYFAGQGKTPASLEILVVDDGSTDGTARAVRDSMRAMPALRLLSNRKNRGKGYSVRRGILEARGCLALFTDADLSSPIEESEKLLAALRGGSDIAIGSRALDRSMISVHQSRSRELAGILFNRLVRLLTGLPFQDTQCGFKAFARERCRIIFEQQRIKGFGFDPEILYLARRHGLRTVEIPVRWAHDPASKVHMFRDSLRMLAGLAYILWNRLAGRYPRA